MKFILDNHGGEAVNIDFVKKFVVKNISWERKFYVAAELSDGEVVLKEFNSENTDENSSAAKTYLSELVDKLNGVAI